MRIAFTGVSHWHAPMYYVPAARLSGVTIVAISDPNPRIADEVGRQLQAKSFTDYKEMLHKAKPDFVFSFGRHCDMAEMCTTLVDEGIPFITEKPGGLTRAQVAEVRDRAKAKGVYAGTGFNFRVSELCRRLQAIIADRPVSHASFRYIAGGPYRYREAGCEWMLDPTQSGGGSTINLSVHFIDLFQYLSNSKPTEVTSLMGNYTWGLPIEDYSSIIMRSPSAVCTVETGYSYPSKFGVFDLRFSLRTSRHYVIARSDNVLEIHQTSDSRMEEVKVETSNMHMYPDFVTDALDRFAKGQPPLASLDDLVDVMEVVDAAFASSRKGSPVTTGPAAAKK